MQFLLISYIHRKLSALALSLDNFYLIVTFYESVAVSLYGLPRASRSLKN